jgi:hypothetical protein
LPISRNIIFFDFAFIFCVNSCKKTFKREATDTEAKHFYQARSFNESIFAFIRLNFAKVFELTTKITDE